MSVSYRIECRQGLFGDQYDLIYRIFVVFMVITTSISLSIADETDSELEADRESTGQVELTLPQQLSDGRPIRTIGLYQSQMDELVPQSFHPISNERLIKGIADLAPQMTHQSSARLASAVYWIDIREGLMVSRRSEFVFDTNSESIVKHSLGPANLAIESPTSLDSIDARSRIPRLENQANGDLVAVFDGGKDPTLKLPFRWQLHGQQSASGYDFDLKLPRSPQTRIVFSVPPRINIVALDGVLRRRSGPPPDAGTLSSNDQNRWFEMDAGGLNRVRIRCRRQPTHSDIDRWIVRTQSAEYQVASTGLNWVFHVLLQAPVDAQFPMIQFRQASVSKVVVNSYDVPFTSVGRGTLRNIRVDPPDEAFRGRTGLTTVSIHGSTPFRSSSLWIDLPIPRWIGNVEIASTVDQVQMLVPDDLEVIKWNLPDEWISRVPLRVGDGSLLYFARGPYSLHAATSATNSLIKNVASMNHWSSVRVARRQVEPSSETTLRLEMADETLNAHARLAVKTDIDGLTPLRIRVEPHWRIESVSFVNSSRVVERPQVPPRGTVYTLWPEPEDIDDGEIVLEVVGSRVLDSKVDKQTIPATWFVAPNDVSDKRFVAFIRPNSLNWASNAAVENDQIDATVLSETAKNFLGVLSSDTLLFQPEFGRSPEISLRRPIASFDAVTQFYVSRDRDEIQETIQIEVESSGKPIQEIFVHAGPDHGRPDFVWSLADQQGSPEIRLPHTAISSGTDTPNETYSINLSDRNLSGHHLIGRRRYIAKPEQSLTLPSIPGATSVRSQAWIGAGLAIAEKPHDVYSIMVGPANQTLNFKAPTDSPPQPIELQPATGLRYEHSRSPTITLAISDRNPDVSVIHDERIEVFASSRGVDRINAFYELAPSKQSIRIQYEPSLRLVSMIRNDSVIDLESFPQRFVTIPPRAETEIVHLTFNRDQYENRWLRNCIVPRISSSGIVLNSEYQLVPASDAFAPTTLLRGNQSTNGNYSSIDLQPGDSVTLIRRNVVLASGWLLSIVVFGLAWIIARRNSLLLACLCVLFVSALLLWWPWKTAIIGWLIVPVVCAAMLATSRQSDRDDKRSNNGHPESRTTNDDPDSKTGSIGNSSDFSVETVFRMIFWLVIFTGLATPPLIAQDPTTILDDPAGQPAEQQVSDSLTDGRAINVLVPVKKSGDQVGTTVYVEKSFYEKLVHPSNVAAKSGNSFQSAEYRIRIDTERLDVEKQSNQIVEANYVVHLESDAGNANSIKFPFAVSSVRRIELLGKRYRLIRFERDTDASVIAYLPAGETFQLRVTLNSKIKRTDAWHKFELPIPRVSASRLTVESSRDISQIRVGGSPGQIFSRTDRQAWSIAIGPTDRLVVEHPTDTESESGQNQSIKRRYLVDVGRRIATIDCQIDLPTAYSAGNTYQFIVRSNRLPLMVSKRWKLQKQELLGSALRRFTVVSTHDQPGPIQMLWTLPINTADASPANPTELSIPEVAATASAQSQNAWVGLRSDPGLQFAPLIGDNIESLSVDHFNGQWRGPQVELDRAFVAISDIPNLVIQLSKPPSSTIHQKHHVHVTSDHLELEFNATLAPDGEQMTLHCLKFPSDLQLRTLRIDGQRQPILLNQYPDHTEVLLRGLDDSESESIQILASAVVPIAPDRKFELPSMAVTHALVSSDEYLISRDPAIAVVPTQGPIAEIDTLTNEIAVDWLRRGWSPLMHWRSDIDAPGKSGPLNKHSWSDRPFQISSFPSEFDCQQVLSIDRDDRGWKMEANIHFSTDQMADVIDIEAPSQWCDSLEVEGALQWIQLGDKGGSRNIIRIRYDKESVSRRSLAIRGRLAQVDSASLIVPRIEVIGPGIRRVYLDIPSQATSGERLAWQTNAVESTAVPSELARPGSSDSTNRSTYLATNPSWSIKLQSVPDQNLEPIAFLQDCNVLSQSGGSLVHCRWDLYPGNLDSIIVGVDKSTTPLAAWSAGRPVEIYLEDNQSDRADEDFQLIRIPISVSRLAQSVEILLRIAADVNGTADYVPQLQGIPIQRSWFVQHLPERLAKRDPLSQVRMSLRGSSRESLAVRNSERLLSLATSIVDSIDSTDAGSGQSRPEIVRQTRRWLTRFGAIRQQANLLTAPSTVRTEWQEIESRLVKLCLRQGVNEKEVAATLEADLANISNSQTSVFGNSLFLGFQIENIAELNSVKQPNIAKHVSSTDRGLNTLIANCLTMILIAGALACLLPFYKHVAPIADHPAFWLGLLGVFGFAIAPTYVAAALVLLAIALPVFPAKRAGSKAGRLNDSSIPG